jgi:hypothetical protein
VQAPDLPVAFFDSECLLPRRVARAELVGDFASSRGRLKPGRNLTGVPPSWLLGAIVGEGLVFAVVDGGGRQTGQVGVHEADLGGCEVHSGLLRPGCPEQFEDAPVEHLVVVLVPVHRRVLEGEVGSWRDTDDRAGVASPFASRRSGGITARVPPIEWPVLPMFRGS